MKADTEHSWLRLYLRLMDNEDVHGLTDSEFRTWIFCLLATKANGGFLPPNKTIAFKLRRKQQVVADQIAEILDVGLLVNVGNELQPTGWNKLQFQSDVSTDRVKRFRNGLRNQSETFLKRPQRQSTETEKELPPPQRATRPQTAETFHGPDPQQLVSTAAEAVAVFWPHRGRVESAKLAWQRAAASSTKGVEAWCLTVIETAREHAAAHRDCKRLNTKHFIPTMELWVADGDYSRPPPEVISQAAGKSRFDLPGEE